MNPASRLQQLALGIAAIAVLSWTAPAHAQEYFGQNKVQHEDFDFRVLKTEHFDIYFYPEEEAAARVAGRMAERWHARLSRALGHQLDGRQPLVLYADHPDFEQTNVVEGHIGESTGGVTEGARRRIVMPFGASLQATDHVLGHELVHAFQYDMLGPAIMALPLWFVEGMAEYLSVGSRDVQTAMWLRDAAIQDHLPTIEDLGDPRYFPYRFGHALWAYIAGRWGDETIGRIMQSVARVGAQGGPGAVSGIEAIERAVEMDSETLSNAWHAAVRETYLLETPREEGILIGERAEDGSLSIGPAISPDGSRVAFLSSRDLLSIDLYLADASTGEVVRKLISTAADPHFDSLQFLQSAGSWEPSGERLAVATIRAGHPVLALIDASDGDIQQEIAFETLGEIFHPAWSPDGGSIAFAAQTGGCTDLYVHDLASGETSRLTNDAFADLQPVWSPDGREVLFVTDRFSADTDVLSFEGYRLGVLDLGSQRIAELTVSVPGNLIDPQWSADGRTVYFISDAEGRPNVYRVDRVSGRSAKVTDEVTGIAGITPLSPALSVAQDGRLAAVSVFRDGGYEIRVRDLSEPVVTGNRTIRDQAVLPPGGRTPTAITQLLQQPSLGLPPASASFEAEEYKSKLELIDVSQAIGASSGQFGTYATGGIQLTFSDMLGNHLVGTGIAVNGGLKDVAASASYLNRDSRWNWGGYVQRLPLVSGRVSTGLAERNGETVFVQQTDLFRQTFTETGVMAAYPFSRATRFEVSASAMHIGFDNELRTQAADLQTGDIVFDETEQLDAPGSLRLAQVGAALVGDTSVFGATSPILGQRFRLDATPSFGDLQLLNLTADVRRYVMPVRPVTLAGRALHYGRYGGNGEDRRLLPLYLGYPTLVRGYDVSSFGPGDCTPTGAVSCPEFDQLVGTRILVLNGEVRAPLVGLFTGRSEYGPLPVELFGFVDSGIAWTDTDRPAFAGGSREWVTSVGAGARVNVFGYLVTELNFARPLDRPEQGWMFVFNLRPGF
jgi:Tol biopolymer transport system component